MYLCTSVRKIREIEQHWGVQRTFGCHPTHLAGWPSVSCEPQILCGGVASSTTQQGLCTMLWSLCGWRDLNRRGFVWASFHSFVFFLPCSCHLLLLPTSLSFGRDGVHAVFAWVHLFTSCIGIRLDEWVRKDFSLSPYETGQTQGKEICVRENKEGDCWSTPPDTLCFLHGWLSHAFPSFLTCYLQWCMPDLSRISFITIFFTHCLLSCFSWSVRSSSSLCWAPHSLISFLSAAIITSSRGHFSFRRRIEFPSPPPCALSHASHRHQSRASVSSFVFYC